MEVAFKRDMLPAELLQALAKQEEDCLLDVFSRYCQVKKIEADIKRLSRVIDEENPDKWEYYVDHGLPTMEFLMGRDLKKTKDKTQLVIYYNSILIPDGGA